MRLVTFERRGFPCLGALVDGEVLDLRRCAAALPEVVQKGYLSSFPPPQEGVEKMNNPLSTPAAASAKLPGSMQAYLAGGVPTQDRVASLLRGFHALSDMTMRSLRESRILQPLEAVRLLAPVPQPGKIICVAMNYPSVSQTGPPEYPPLFLKPASSLLGSGRAVRIPPAAKDVAGEDLAFEDLAFEAELVLVIGRTARRVPEGEALSCLAGYTMANDLGDRLLEKRTSQWTTGKLMDTFTPVGPALVTPDEVPDPGNLEIHSWVNGKLVQQGNTCQMFFSAPALVSYISHLATLQPGDVILTGSPKRLGADPAPVISLQPGDQVAIEIGSLGRLENRIVAERD